MSGIYKNALRNLEYIFCSISDQSLLQSSRYHGSARVERMNHRQYRNAMKNVFNNVNDFPFSEETDKVSQHIHKYLSLAFCFFILITFNIIYIRLVIRTMKTIAHLVFDILFLADPGKKSGPLLYSIQVIPQKF